MSIPQLFIRRPVAAILLALGLAGAGGFAYNLLPVAALPRADFPTISVSAQLAGASPQTMATAVATPIIKQLQTIAGIDSVSARSSLGSTSISVQFNLSRDINSAAADVQAALAIANRQLPANMTSSPSYRKSNPADSPILMLSLHSDTMPMTQIDSIAQNQLGPAISTVNGVAQAQIFGSQKYAVRVQADPNRLAARGIGLDQIATALTNANSQTPVGTMQNALQTITLDVPTQRTNADEFRSLIVANPNGNIVRLGDVANVVDSVENLNQASWHNTDRAITLAIFRQPDANTVSVVDGIKAALPALTSQLPPSLKVDILNDSSVPIRSAVEDVQYTLFLTVGLVVLVIYLFLGKLVSTLIPAIAVPLSILATFGAMYVMGYSIDNLSLLGLTLSVGLVVDDAIVMLENIIHHVEQGEKPFEAALKGSAEVSTTIISMSLSLIAVFLPILFMGGIVGRLFLEFGMVVSLSIAASALVSLVVTPTLSARLPASTAEPPSVWSPAGLFNILFGAIQRGYGRSVGWCLRHQFLIFLVFLATIGGSSYLFATLPKGFLPQEDTGQLSISLQARQDISFDQMSRMVQRAQQAVLKSPDVDQLVSSVGGGFTASTNAASMFVMLKPRDQRRPVDQTIADLRRDLGRMVGLQSFISVPQSLRLGGRSSQSTYQLVMQSIDANQLADWSHKLQNAMAADSAHFVDVASDLQDNALQAEVKVNLDRASALGITASTIRSTLGDGFGTQQAAQIQSTGDSYQVILEYGPNANWSNDLLSDLRIRASGLTSSGSSSGISNSPATLVPLSAFAKVERKAGPVTVNQTGQLTAITLSFNLPKGVALGDATAAIDRIKSEIGLPSTIFTAYAGTAQVFAQSTQNMPILIGAAVLTIYVVLGVLYESFIHPLTILSGLPAAAFGALLALQLMGMDLSIIALIGILMLIGIVKKNAIMMIDVALQLRREGEPSVIIAIQEACVRRFRPIMMTTFCALLGTLPIAIGGGASSELRQPLGIVVVGGLIVSQILTLFITPVIFVFFENLSGWVLKTMKKTDRPETTDPAKKAVPHAAPAE